MGLRRFACLILPFTLCFVGCTTPDAVSKFCGSAAATLTSAAPVFTDMEQSCLREVNSRQEFGTFMLPVQSDPGCNAIATQATGAAAATKILSDYFTALNSVASFGTAKAGTDAQNLLQKTSAAFGANSGAQNALGSIAQFLVSAATSGVQARDLEKDLTKANSDISTVVDALIAIVKTNYIGQGQGQGLESEEQKLATRYKEFAKGASPEVKLMLDDRWHADEQMLTARRASAQSLVTALQALQKGFADLAKTAHNLKAKEVQGLLDPYVTQLQSLIPQIQKAF